jgi:hypothetical protein
MISICGLAGVFPESVKMSNMKPRKAGEIHRLEAQ